MLQYFLPFNYQMYFYNGTLLLYITPPPSSFNLSPPRVDEMAGFYPYLINTFLKFLVVAVKLNITVQISLPH